MVTARVQRERPVRYYPRSHAVCAQLDISILASEQAFQVVQGKSKVIVVMRVSELIEQSVSSATGDQRTHAASRNAKHPQARPKYGWYERM